jgi:hypothetical protein
MDMDIRPDPFRRSSSEDGDTPFRSSRGFPNGWKLRVIVFGVAVGIVLLLAVIWYAVGAPGAPPPVKRSLARLPIAGNRFLPERQPSEEPATVPTPPPDLSSPLSGLRCANARRRPISVMLASDPINRPVSGFAFADVVFELPVLVNSVTRLLAVYQCQEPREIGSVRSARHDYLFLARGVDAVIAHWGGSYHTLNRIRFERRVYDSLSALGTGQQAFFRKSNLPAPYNGFTSYSRLWDALGKAGYRTQTVFRGYSHVDEAPPGQRGTGGALDIGWPGAMRVRYVYHPQENVYERFWGGQRHLDSLDNVPVSPKVLVVAYTEQRLARGPGGYNDVDVEGSGNVEVYQNGQVIQGTWEKSEIHKQDPLLFKDASGQEIPLVRGQLWVHFVDSRTTVRWTPGPSAPPELDTGTTPTNLGG